MSKLLLYWEPASMEYICIKTLRKVTSLLASSISQITFLWGNCYHPQQETSQLDCCFVTHLMWSISREVCVGHLCQAAGRGERVWRDSYVPEVSVLDQETTEGDPDTRRHLNSWTPIVSPITYPTAGVNFKTPMCNCVNLLCSKPHTLTMTMNAHTSSVMYSMITLVNLSLIWKLLKE